MNEKNFFIIQSINDYSFYYLFYCLIFFLQLKPHLSGTISKNKMDKKKKKNRNMNFFLSGKIQNKYT